MNYLEAHTRLGEQITVAQNDPNFEWLLKLGKRLVIHRVRMYIECATIFAYYLIFLFPGTIKAIISPVFVVKSVVVVSAGIGSILMALLRTKSFLIVHILR